MADLGAEAPRPPVRKYRRFDSREEQREVKRQEKPQKEGIDKSEARRQAALKALRQDTPEVPDRADLENLAELDNQPEVITPIQKIKRADDVERHFNPDQWRSTGSLRINGDCLNYLPAFKVGDNPYIPGNKSHDNFEKYGVDTGEHPLLLRSELEKRVERGVELATTPDPEIIDPQIAGMTELKRIPLPVLWEVLEANPNSAQNKYTFKSSARELVISADYSIQPVFDKDTGEFKEGKVMYAWDGMVVDKETLITMQQKALEYLETQVKERQMPQAILDAAKGILIYTSNAPEDPDVEKKGEGSTQDDPKMEIKWWRLFAADKWTKKGQLGLDGDYLYYQNNKLKKQDRRRRVTIASLDSEDQSGQNFVLTRTAWEILRKVPSRAPGFSDSIAIVNADGLAVKSLEKPLQDKKGRWKVEPDRLVTDSQTLDQMQILIRRYVEKQVAEGRMKADVLGSIDGILKYKLPTLEPVSVYTNGNVIYRLKGKERRFVEKREPTLVGKIAEEANKAQGLSQVETVPDDIKKYLSSKNLPAGSSIKNIGIEFSGTGATLTGIVDVPIPFVGGKINFLLELANNPESTGLIVTNHHVDTESGNLRSRLGELESSLNDINRSIIDDINEQLQFSNPTLRVQGITLTPDGKFAFRVQNSAQVAT